MEKRIEAGWLLDFYGPLLPERQRMYLRMYCDEDLSLAEIAEQEGITRQGVHDAVRKGEAQLRGYERQLGLLARYRRLTDGLQACLDALERIEAHPEHTGALEAVCAELSRLQAEEE